MANGQIYVYSLEGTADDLREWVNKCLGSPVWYWVADVVQLEVDEGVPTGWKEQGAVFNEQGELRWWRRDGGYEALLITEQPVPGLSALPGLWQAEIQAAFLQNLREPRVNPNFKAYPGGNSAGKIEVKVCYRDGVATLVSLRRFLQIEEE